MRSRLGIAVILPFIFMAGPVGAQACSADKMHTLNSCVYSGTEKNSTASSFEQLYELDNDCGYDVEVIVKVNTGEQISVALDNGEKKWAILPEGEEVTGFYCCAVTDDCSLSE